MTSKLLEPPRRMPMPVKVYPGGGENVNEGGTNIEQVIMALENYIIRMTKGDTKTTPVVERNALPEVVLRIAKYLKLSVRG